MFRRVSIVNKSNNSLGIPTDYGLSWLLLYRVCSLYEVTATNNRKFNCTRTVLLYFYNINGCNAALNIASTNQQHHQQTCRQQVVEVVGVGWQYAIAIAKRLYRQQITCFWPRWTTDWMEFVYTIQSNSLVHIQFNTKYPIFLFFAVATHTYT